MFLLLLNMILLISNIYIYFFVFFQHRNTSLPNLVFLVMGYVGFRWCGVGEGDVATTVTTNDATTRTQHNHDDDDTNDITTTTITRRRR